MTSASPKRGKKVLRPTFLDDVSKDLFCYILYNRILIRRLFFSNLISPVKIVGPMSNPKPTLSFTKSKDAIPVAIVKGGDRHNEFLYLDEGVKSTTSERKNTRKKRLDDDELVTKVLSEIEGRLIEKPEKKVVETELTLPDDSMFYPIPSADGEKRQVYYICGQSGSGKSYMARMLADGYKKMYPDRKVYLVSEQEEDPTIDKVKPIRIDVNELADNPPPLENFSDSMVIFDDVDAIPGKKGAAIHTYLDRIAIRGRHTNTTLIFITHLLTNYKRSRIILSETSHFIVYPQATAYKPLLYLLQTYLGLEGEQVKKLRRLGRWVLFHKNFPQYMVSSHTALILHQEGSDW